MRLSLIPVVLTAILLGGHGNAAEAPAILAAHASATDAARLGMPVAEGRLAASRGGSDVHNNARTIGDVTGNSANHMVTGMNVLQDGAFAHASGITTVVQNSGANVLIQNAMVVNVQFGAAGQ